MEIEMQQRLEQDMDEKKKEKEGMKTDDNDYEKVSADVINVSKGLFTQSKSVSESEKDQRIRKQ